MKMVFNKSSVAASDRQTSKFKGPQEHITHYSAAAVLCCDAN